MSCGCLCHASSMPVNCACCYGYLGPTTVTLPYTTPAPHYPMGNIQFQTHPDILDRLVKIELQLELLINNLKDRENERKENDEERWRDVKE